MTNQRFPLSAAAFAVVGLSFAVAGCILGSDPNVNTVKFGSLGGSNGGAGIGGGGAAGSDLTTIPGIPIALFDASNESFGFSTYDEPTNLAVHNGGTPPTLDLDMTDSSPAGGGSLKVSAPYSGANQYVDVQSKAFPATMLQNWAGGKLHVRVKVDTGFTFAGQIEPYADTTAGFVFVGTSLNVVAGGGWHDYVVNLDGAMTRNSGYDLKQVILFGVHIGSGTGGGSQGPVTFHIDSFSVEGIASPAGDAGTGVGGGSGSGSDAASGN